MSDILTRLKKCISYSESKALKAILEYTNFESGILVTSKIADQAKITRSVVVGALCKAEIAGLMETRSLGAKGTHIRVLEKAILQNFIKEMM